MAADVRRQAPKQAEVGPKATIAMLTSLTSDTRPTDCCVHKQEIRNGAAGWFRAVGTPILAAGVEAMRSGHPLPG